MKTIISNKYEINELLGEGSFGKIFKTINIYNKKEFAVKLEFKNEINTLKKEAQIYTYLKNTKGIPLMYNYGVYEGFNYLILDLLGPSIIDVSLNIENKIKYLIEAIDIIENLHEKNLVHRDIKPDNFLLNIQKNQLYIIDFGLTKIYFKNNKHIEENNNKKLLGTPNYCSLNIHNGKEYSRRDDLESLCYTFISVYGIELPWKKDNNNKIEKEELYNKIKIMKEKPLDWLYEYPGEFIIFLLYCRNLKFSEHPNYKYLKNLFINLINI